ncbi:hypothetical protein L3X38_036254 [Prunus dulcis]|uniref:Uncharacterized protein n=1 Tax=Prunus dulcis TaxID=3755 RepID=A0AAD4V377_PRUDU|nr:hypothetical protein L3X38_036254 [Prunus dulcis]
MALACLVVASACRALPCHVVGLGMPCLACLGLALACRGLGLPSPCVGVSCLGLRMSWPSHALAFICFALAWPWYCSPFNSSHFEKVRLLEAWHGVALACLAKACRGLGMSCLGLGIAPFKAFRESEAIGSLACLALACVGMSCLGLGMPCLGLGLPLALPHSRHFEKVRLLEAWHGVALACLALACFGMSCLGIGMAWPCMPWP